MIIIFLCYIIILSEIDIINMLTVIEQGQRGGMMVVVVLTSRRRVTAHAGLQRVHQTDAVDRGVRRRRRRVLEVVRGGGGLHGRA